MCQYKYCIQIICNFTQKDRGLSSTSVSTFEKVSIIFEKKETTQIRHINKIVKTLLRCFYFNRQRTKHSKLSISSLLSRNVCNFSLSRISVKSLKTNMAINSFVLQLKPMYFHIFFSFGQKHLGKKQKNG